MIFQSLSFDTLPSQKKGSSVGPKKGNYDLHRGGALMNHQRFFFVPYLASFHWNGLQCNGW